MDVEFLDALLSLSFFIFFFLFSFHHSSYFPTEREEYSKQER